MMAILPVAKTSAPRRGLRSRWRLYLLRHQTRKSLLLLDNARLADIGLTREEAWREGCKPFWRE